MSCPATSDNPCMCSCHAIMVEGELGERPLFGCNECNQGQKLREPME